MGIIDVVLWFFGWSSMASMILGIAGLALASKSKAQGYMGEMRTAGFVLSLSGLIGGALFFLSCVACAGALGSLSAI